MSSFIRSSARPIGQLGLATSVLVGPAYCSARQENARNNNSGGRKCCCPSVQQVLRQYPLLYAQGYGQIMPGVHSVLGPRDQLFSDYHLNHLQQLSLKAREHDVGSLDLEKHRLAAEVRYARAEKYKDLETELVKLPLYQVKELAKDLKQQVKKAKKKDSVLVLSPDVITFAQTSDDADANEGGATTCKCCFVASAGAYLATAKESLAGGKLFANMQKSVLCEECGTQSTRGSNEESGWAEYLSSAANSIDLVPENVRDVGAEFADKYYTTKNGALAFFANAMNSVENRLDSIDCSVEGACESAKKCVASLSVNPFASSAENAAKSAPSVSEEPERFDVGQPGLDSAQTDGLNGGRNARARKMRKPLKGAKCSGTTDIDEQWEEAEKNREWYVRWFHTTCRACASVVPSRFRRNRNTGDSEGDTEKNGVHRSNAAVVVGPTQLEDDNLSTAAERTRIEAVVRRLFDIHLQVASVLTQRELEAFIDVLEHCCAGQLIQPGTEAAHQLEEMLLDAQYMLCQPEKPLLNGDYVQSQLNRCFAACRGFEFALESHLAGNKGNIVPEGTSWKREFRKKLNKRTQKLLKDTSKNRAMMDKPWVCRAISVPRSVSCPVHTVCSPIYRFTYSVATGSKNLVVKSYNGVVNFCNDHPYIVGSAGVVVVGTGATVAYINGAWDPTQSLQSAKSAVVLVADVVRNGAMDYVLQPVGKFGGFAMEKVAQPVADKLRGPVSTVGSGLARVGYGTCHHVNALGNGVIHGTQRFVIQPVGNYVVNPLGKYVIAPVGSYVVAPVGSFSSKYILSPVHNYAVQPVITASQYAWSGTKTVFFSNSKAGAGNELYSSSSNAHNTDAVAAATAGTGCTTGNQAGGRFSGGLRKEALDLLNSAARSVGRMIGRNRSMSSDSITTEESGFVVVEQKASRTPSGSQ